MEIRAFSCTPFATNCFVVTEGDEAIVVDPGDATAELVEVVGRVRVRAIINTHGHCDHCGGNAALVAQTGAELLCHEDDAPLLHALSQQGAMFGLSFQPSPDPDRFVADGDTITLGPHSMRILHVPGHTPGHIALHGDGFILAGDVLFAGSIGRTDLPGGDHRRLLTSIRERLLPLPDETIVYSGHGPATTIGDERRHNPFLVAL